MAVMTRHTKQVEKAPDAESFVTRSSNILKWFIKSISPFNFSASNCFRTDNCVAQLLRSYIES